MKYWEPQFVHKWITGEFTEEDTQAMIKYFKRIIGREVSEKLRQYKNKHKKKFKCSERFWTPEVGDEESYKD